MPGLEQYPPVMIRTFFSFLLCTFACPGDERPNVVILLADDLGYGEVSCLNPEGKIPTPNLDQLAKDGMTFTDAHSGSSVCTLTRYGLLTGRYCGAADSKRSSHRRRVALRKRPLRTSNS